MYDTLRYYATERNAADPDNSWDGTVSSKYNTSQEFSQGTGTGYGSIANRLRMGTARSRRNARTDSMRLDYNGG
jgi:hypothetical protein